MSYWFWSEIYHTEIYIVMPTESRENLKINSTKTEGFIKLEFSLLWFQSLSRLGPFIIVMQKAWFEICFRFIRNQKHTEFFYSCIFDVQYTIVSDTGVSFSTSNLIRVEFKIN